MCPLPVCFFFVFFFVSFIRFFLLLLKLFFTPGYYDFNNGNCHTQVTETTARTPEEMATPEMMQEPPQNAKTQPG
jgi:hypothetical protein